MDVFTASNCQGHAPLRLWVLSIPAVPAKLFKYKPVDIILFPHTKGCAVATDGEILKVLCGEHRITSAAILAPFCCNDCPAFKNQLLVSSKLNRLDYPIGVHIRDNHPFRTRVNCRLQSDSCVFGVESPPRRVGSSPFSRTHIRNRFKIFHFSCSIGRLR